MCHSLAVITGKLVIYVCLSTQVKASRQINFRQAMAAEELRGSGGRLWR